jgi:hypothetical protein
VILVGHWARRVFAATPARYVQLAGVTGWQPVDACCRTERRISAWRRCVGHAHVNCARRTLEPVARRTDTSTRRTTGYARPAPNAMPSPATSPSPLGLEARYASHTHFRGTHAEDVRRVWDRGSGNRGAGNRGSGNRGACDRTTGASAGASNRRDGPRRPWSGAQVAPTCRAVREPSVPSLPGRASLQCEWAAVAARATGGRLTGTVHPGPGPTMVT